LKQAAPFLRRSLAQTASLRFTPELRFEIDASVESGSRVDQILDEIGTAQTPDDPGEDES
jgi:ribosome-binding factor A